MRVELMYQSAYTIGLLHLQSAPDSSPYFPKPLAAIAVVVAVDQLLPIPGLLGKKP